MELCLTVSILVLQAEGLVCAIRKSWFPLSDDHSWCILRTTTDCRPYRSSLSVYRLGRNRSSGLVGGFRRLRLSNRGLALKARRNLDRCRYRYTCRPRTLPVRGGCRPKRSGFGFRGRSRLNHAGMTFLKLLCLSDGLAGVLCLNPTYGYYMIQFYLASRLY